MNWVYIIPILLLTDALLYMRYWQLFAKRYYFMPYGFGVGWRMAYKIRRKDD